MEILDSFIVAVTAIAQSLVDATVYLSHHPLLAAAFAVAFVGAFVFSAWSHR